MYVFSDEQTEPILEMGLSSSRNVLCYNGVWVSPERVEKVK